ncbi:Tubulin-specific chaperone C [Phytophthora cactorum]|nr:Tubulin-specific chaperone C [Phytophthora cactorum]
METPLAIGARCELLSSGPSGSLRASIKRYGEIAYIGRYFDCKPLHGAIVRPERVNTNGEFPVFTTHEESLAHALESDARRNKMRECGDGNAYDASKLHRELTTDELATAFWEEFTQQEEHVRKQKKQPLPCDPAKEVKLDALLILSKLLELIETTRTTFAPRKKFTFRARAAKRAKAKEVEKQDQPESSASADSTGNQQFPSTTQRAIEFDELVHANKQNEPSFADADDSKRRDLNFSCLTNCVVLVCVETSAIRGDALKNCFVARELHGCEFFVACRQLRVHLSTATTFHLRIRSHPIIEDCQQMQFGPYRDSGLWAKVNDFKWHKTQQSPNWSIRDPKQPLPKIPVELEKLVSYD